MVKEPESSITLFYGNRDFESIIFNEHLTELQSQNPEKFRIVHILDNPPPNYSGYTGLMNRDKALQLLRENTDLNFTDAEVFICGPGPMMAEVKSAMDLLMVPKEKIHIEYFTAKEPSDQASAEAVSANNGAELTEIDPNDNTLIKIKYDGKEHEFEMRGKETVLEAALDAGLDPPYSCMVAVCCTCRAKLISGKVEIDFINEKYNLNFPIGAYETIAGFIIDNLGSIPKANETVSFGNYKFLIIRADKVKIDLVKLTLLSDDQST